MDDEIILILLFVIIIVAYIIASIRTSRYFRKWPLTRILFWVLGVSCIAATVIGPLANQAHTDFVVHMIIHLLLGMLAPLFLVLAAPITLIFRTLNVNAARRLSSLLKSRLVSTFSNPVVASLLNIGGLWILYTTDLYLAMQHNHLIHILVHIHVFLAGYLFTASLIYIDPTPHHFSFRYRTIVFIFALAGHGILSKYIYAYPPSGVLRAEAELGGMLMYYGGDIIDAGIIVILFYQWYKVSRPKKVLLL